MAGKELMMEDECDEREHSVWFKGKEGFVVELWQERLCCSQYQVQVTATEVTKAATYGEIAVKVNTKPYISYSIPTSFPSSLIQYQQVLLQAYFCRISLSTTLCCTGEHTFLNIRFFQESHSFV